MISNDRPSPYGHHHHNPRSFGQPPRPPVNEDTLKTDKVQIDQSLGPEKVVPAAVPDTLDVDMQILNELRAIRRAIVALVCADGRFVPADFVPDNFSISEEQEN